jgi:hypothetical protein
MGRTEDCAPANLKLREVNVENRDCVSLWFHVVLKVKDKVSPGLVFVARLGALIAHVSLGWPYRAALWTVATTSLTCSRVSTGLIGIARCIRAASSVPGSSTPAPHSRIAT